MANKHPSGAPWRNFYGRRKGKALRRSQQEYLATDLAEIAFSEAGWTANPDRTPVDLASRFPNARSIWLEIGFGGGEHLVHQAANHPDIGFIGCEPFINGVAMLLGKIHQKNLKNLLIYPGDVRDVFDVVPERAFGRAFLLYPDPWPKKKHHRRRFVTPEFLAPLAEKMEHGAELRIATDISDYVRQSLVEITNSAHFVWTAKGPSDWRTPWPDWISTRYEQKALREGRTPHYLTFVRI